MFQDWHRLHAPPKARGGMTEHSRFGLSQPQNISYEAFGKIKTVNYLTLKQRKHFRSFSSVLGGFCLFVCFSLKTQGQKFQNRCFGTDRCFQVLLILILNLWSHSFCVGSFASSLVSFDMNICFWWGKKMTAFGTQIFLPSEI